MIMVSQPTEKEMDPIAARANELRELLGDAETVYKGLCEKRLDLEDKLRRLKKESMDSVGKTADLLNDAGKLEAKITGVINKKKMNACVSKMGERVLELMAGRAIGKLAASRVDTAAEKRAVKGLVGKMGCVKAWTKFVERLEVIDKVVATIVFPPALFLDPLRTKFDAWIDDVFEKDAREENHESLRKILHCRTMLRVEHEKRGKIQEAKFETEDLLNDAVSRLHKLVKERKELNKEYRKAHLRALREAHEKRVGQESGAKEERRAAFEKAKMNYKSAKQAIQRQKEKLGKGSSEWNDRRWKKEREIYQKLKAEEIRRWREMNEAERAGF